MTRAGQVAAAAAAQIVPRDLADLVQCKQVFDEIDREFKSKIPIIVISPHTEDKHGRNVL